MGVWGGWVFHFSCCLLKQINFDRDRESDRDLEAGTNDQSLETCEKLTMSSKILNYREYMNKRPINLL